MEQQLPPRALALFVASGFFGAWAASHLTNDYATSSQRAFGLCIAVVTGVLLRQGVAEWKRSSSE